MTEILIDKREVTDIRDSLNKLLKSGKENVRRHNQYAPYESEELSEREKKILKYAEKNPGTTKEDVIKYMEKERICSSSRMTTVKLINGLVKDGKLLVKRDDSNQRIQHLYFNNEDLVLSILKDFEFFKQVYFVLIDKTIDILKKMENKLLGYFQVLDLVAILLIPYKHLIIMYFMSDLLLRREQPIDKNILHAKFTIVYSNMKEIHSKLHEYITPMITTPFDRDINIEPLDSSLYDIEGALSSENIERFLRFYEMYRLSSFAEAVLDILWKISYPILPSIDPLYASEDLETLKDWRNIIAGYKPKTTQAQNLGK